MRTFLLAASLCLATGLSSAATAGDGSFTVLDLQTGDTSVGQPAGAGGYTVQHPKGGISIIQSDRAGGYTVHDLQSGGGSVVRPAAPGFYHVLNLKDGSLSILQFQGDAGTWHGPQGR